MKSRSIWTPSFVPLFVGQSVSAVGSQITFVALPLIAVLSLGATPGAMGLLGAIDNLPYLLIGLWVGVLVDRFSRRRIMIASDLLRAVAVLSIPILSWSGQLSFAHLCVVAFAVGVGNITFDVACQAQLPELVDESELVAANGALATSASLATVGAPGVVGLVIKAVGAPVALLVDAASYLVSMVGIVAIRQPERPRPAPEESGWRQVSTGLRIVLGDRRLLGLGGGAAMISFGMNAAFAVLVFYLATGLGLDALWIGLVFLAFGLGGLTAALLGGALSARFGPSPVLVAGPIIGAVGLALVSASAAGGDSALVLVLAGAATIGAGLLAYQMVAAGLRQSLTADSVRGRVLGTLRFLEWGAMPLGSLAGGALGEWLGAGPTLACSGIAVAASSLWTLGTPLRSVSAPASESRTGSSTEPEPDSLEA